MQILSNILAFVFVVGIIIFVHELGHHLVAKAFGVRVLTFSLGFGKRVWGFRRGETDYRLSLIPLGGYVHFGGQDPAESSDEPRDYLNHPRWQRVLILFAGPAMNVLLSVVLVAIVFMVGTSFGTQKDRPAVVGWVEEESPAAGAGLRAGDRFVSIDGEQIENWQQVAMRMSVSPGQRLAVVVEREGRTLSTTLTPEEDPKYKVGEAGLFSGVLRVARAPRGSPARRAGFRYGDSLQRLDGERIADHRDFLHHVSERPGREIQVDVVRDGRPLTLTVVPRAVVMIGVEFDAASEALRIQRVLAGSAAEEAGFAAGDIVQGVDGVQVTRRSDFVSLVKEHPRQQMHVDVIRDGARLRLSVEPRESGTTEIVLAYFHYRRYSPGRAIVASLGANVDMTRQTFYYLWNIIQGRIPAQSALSGPIEIAALSGAAARSQFRDLVFVVAVISLSLFIINLLPIPILDGGQILILLIEGTLRRDLSLRLKERMTQVGVVLIVMLMAMALYFDLVKNLP